MLARPHKMPWLPFSKRGLMSPFNVLAWENCQCCTIKLAATAEYLWLLLQMPKGVPVATVAIGNAANAGLLAARILGTSDLFLFNKMAAYQVTFCPAIVFRAAFSFGT